MLRPGVKLNHGVRAKPATVLVISEKRALRQQVSNCLSAHADLLCLSNLRKISRADLHARQLLVLVLATARKRPVLHCARELKSLDPKPSLLLISPEEVLRNGVTEWVTAGVDGMLTLCEIVPHLPVALQTLLGRGSFASPLVAAALFRELRRSPAHNDTTGGLSRRELEIVVRLTRHEQYKEIAESLNLSYHTVRTHVRRIYTKLGVHSRNSAVAKLHGLGFKTSTALPP